MNSSFAKKIRDDSKYMLICPLDNVKNVATKISGCTVVFSSSLHGLILADSYGIPNAHIIITNKLQGDTYKFEDYYSGVGRKYSNFNADSVFD